MIITLILSGFFAILTFIFSVFTLPAMPLAVANGIANVLQFFTIPIGVLRNYLGDTFFFAVIVLIIAYITIFPTIHIVIWVYSKVRGA